MSRGFALPNDERPTMTKSRRFELEYDVDAVGPSGVARVELYRTTDNGAAWKLVQTDPDLKSPIQVAVEGEGVFGYRIVVVSNNGLAGRKPMSGDQADLWIGVDLTAPQARITSAAYGKGARVGQLDIRWDARDAALGERPIALRFSPSPDGPWTTIASGLPNSGQYYWAAGSRTPPEIYLRLEVRDSAGNLGVHRLEHPLKMDGLSPRGRIRGFRPVGSE